MIVFKEMVKTLIVFKEMVKTLIVFKEMVKTLIVFKEMVKTLMMMLSNYSIYGKIINILLTDFCAKIIMCMCKRCLMLILNF